MHCCVCVNEFLIRLGHVCQHLLSSESVGAEHVIPIDTFLVELAEKEERFIIFLLTVMFPWCRDIEKDGFGYINDG